MSGDVRVQEELLRRATEARTAEQRLLATVEASRLTAARLSFDQLAERLGESMPLSPEACAAGGESLTAGLQSAIDRVGRELVGYAQRMIQAMSEVRRRWPEATTEMDASVEARGEFLAFHDRVATDDLPRFENEFKRQLNTNTIRERAQFNNWLRRQAQEIHSKVDRINEALGAIDYSPGRYILLVTERTVNTEVQDFRSERRLQPTTPCRWMMITIPSSGSWMCSGSSSVPRTRGPRRGGPCLDRAGYRCPLLVHLLGVRA